MYWDLIKEKYKTVITALDLKLQDPLSKDNMNGRAFLGMKSKRRDINCLEFDSYFENGNLDTVVTRPNSNEYDLYLRPDTNTQGHTLWYYYRVRRGNKG